MDVVERDRRAVPSGVDEQWAVSDRIGHQLIRLIRLIERRHSAKLRVDGVERAAYLLLGRLVLDGPRRSNALAEAVHSDPSTVSRQVAALVRVGLVERRPDPEDGRACLLAPTAEGLRVFETNRRRRNEEISALTADWDEADRVALATLLQRFTSGLEERPDLPAPDDPAPALPEQSAPAHIVAPRGGEGDR